MRKPCGERTFERGTRTGGSHKQRCNSLLRRAFDQGRAQFVQRPRNGDAARVKGDSGNGTAPDCSNGQVDRDTRLGHAQYPVAEDRVLSRNQPRLEWRNRAGQPDAVRNSAQLLRQQRHQFAGVSLDVAGTLEYAVHPPVSVRGHAIADAVRAHDARDPTPAAARRASAAVRRRLRPAHAWSPTPSRKSRLVP